MSEDQDNHNQKWPFAKRAELVARREELHAQLDRQRRRHGIRDLLAYLEANAIEHQLDFAGNFSRWLANSFPFGWSAIDWEQVPDAVIQPFATGEERDELITRVLGAVCTADDRIRIISTNGRDPELEVAAQVVLHNPSLFADEFWNDLWFVVEAKRFCLEIYHEDRAAWGYSTNTLV